ncbi:MAG: FAD:protein FMN transferase [Bryobacteraceae bacterium]
MTSNKFAIAPLLVLAAFARPPADKTLNPYEAVEAHMGTLFRIKLYAPDERSARQAFQAAFRRIDQLNKILSDYLPESELSRITHQAVGHPVRVSDDLFRIAQSSEQLSIATGGAFDLTIGPLTHLWRQARQDHTLPQPEAVQSALARCGYRKLHLDSAAQTIEFDAPRMLLDAGGIAKGYAADEALTVLANLGFRSALVAASGDLAFGDAPPGKAGWKIGVDSFDRADKPFTRVLMLSNAAVSTSGSSEQHLNTVGKSYSHIIDPKTGMGLQNDLTVTAISRRGITADAAATAISVLGCKTGLAYAAGQPDLAVFLMVKSDGHAKSFETARFRDLVGDKSFKETSENDR